MWIVDLRGSLLNIHVQVQTYMYHITMSLRLVKSLFLHCLGFLKGARNTLQKNASTVQLFFLLQFFIYFLLHSLVELTKTDALYHSCILLTKGYVINSKVELFRSQLSILTTQNSYFSGISTKPTENYGVIRKHCLQLVRTSQQLHC